MLCNKKIEDYVVEPAKYVSKRLKEGYKLYGLPLIREKIVYQAMVKLAEGVKVSEVEAKCLNYLRQGYSTKEIGKLMKIEPKTLERIFSELRKRNNCKRSTDLTFLIGKKGLQIREK